MNCLRERKKNRLQSYNYSQNGYYFVTTCVCGMQCVLGEIVEQKIRLNELGKIVENCLLGLSSHYENCEILCYSIMPNHVHMVLFLDNPNVGDRYICPLLKRNTELLSDIIGKFKAAVSRNIHQLGYGDFKWQRSFHDHIIRNDEEYERISEYVLNNSLNWNTDDCFKSC